MPTSFDPDSPCPCGSGSNAGNCCEPLLTGRLTAPTAERLMRSRFSAFVTGDANYLHRTWHSTTRPVRVDLDKDRYWTRLEIVGTTGGGLLHTDGTVEFTAFYRTKPSRSRKDRRAVRELELHQYSTFTREDAQWVYVDSLGSAP